MMVGRAWSGCGRAGPARGIPYQPICHSARPDRAGQQWLALLEDGALPERDPKEGPGSYMVQPEWRALLEDSIARGGSNHWLGWLHLGVMKMEVLDTEGAREAWLRVDRAQPSAWAYRNLAVIEDRAGRLDETCDLMRRAWEPGRKLPQSPLNMLACWKEQTAGMT